MKIMKLVFMSSVLSLNVFRLFRSFVLTRAINITIDYTGTGTGISLDDVKTMATTAIQGVLQLENMQIDLKALECKRG